MKKNNNNNLWTELPSWSSVFLPSFLPTAVFFFFFKCSWSSANVITGGPCFALRLIQLNRCIYLLNWCVILRQTVSPNTITYCTKHTSQDCCHVAQGRLTGLIQKWFSCVCKEYNLYLVAEAGRMCDTEEEAVTEWHQASQLFS